MADLKIVSLSPPVLAEKDFFPAGVVQFLLKWDQYMARVAAIPGLVASPLDLAINSDLLNSWVDMGRIPDRNVESIRLFLNAQAVMDAPLVDVTTVFTKAALSYDLALEPVARVQSLFTKVTRLIRENNISSYLQKKKHMFAILNLIVDVIKPIDAAEVIRLQVNDRVVPFTLAELQDVILPVVKYEEKKLQQEKLRLAKTTSEKMKANIPAAMGNTAVPEQTVGMTVTMKDPSTKPLLSKTGKPITCYHCGQNHYVQQCPTASDAEKIAQVAKQTSTAATAASAPPASKPWVREGTRLERTSAPATTTAVTKAAPAGSLSVLYSERVLRGLEILSCKLNEKITVDALCDSGANYCVISKTVVLALALLTGTPYQLIPWANSDKRIILGDSETNMMVEGLMQLDLTFQNEGRLRIEFLVVDRELPFVVLGNNLLRAFDVRVADCLLEKLASTPDVEISMQGQSDAAPSLSFAAITLASADDGIFRYTPNRAGAEIAPEEMDTVLTENVDNVINVVPDLPPIENLFPILKEDAITTVERNLIETFYGKLPDLLYTGTEPILNRSYHVDLLPGAIPTRCRNRPLAPAVREFLEDCRDAWLKAGYISPLDVEVEWCSFVFAVPKPGSFEGYRAVVDYVAVNKQTRPATYPMPFLDADHDTLNDARYFGLLDLLKGYRQAQTDEPTSRILAIMLLNRIYHVHRLFEGPTNAVSFFQSVFNEALQRPLTPIQQKEITAIMEADDLQTYEYAADAKRIRLWIDDSMLHERTVTRHVHFLWRVLIRLRDARLRLNLKKCVFLASKVVHVGRTYSAAGMGLDPERVQVLLNTPIPTNGADLMYFLNSINWNRTCIPAYSELAAPLYSLLQRVMETTGSRKKTKAGRIRLDDAWLPEHTTAFTQLKQVLASSVLLDFPRQDHCAFLFSDASDGHHASVLMHCPIVDLALPLGERAFRPLAFTSGSFTQSSANWDIQSKEAFATDCPNSEI